MLTNFNSTLLFINFYWLLAEEVLDPLARYSQLKYDIIITLKSINILIIR